MPNDTMTYNFNLLQERILDTLTHTNYPKQLKKIKGVTICVGSGGSKAVADFASKVFNIQNNCPTKVFEPRDTLYENLSRYKNLFVCSYSGNNHGVNILSKLPIKKYLLTYGESENKDYKQIKCNSTLPKELSFISIAATLMPMSILLSYKGKKETANKITNMLKAIKSIKFDINNYNLPFDVMSGNDTTTAEIFLDSTFVESGLGILTRHSKYDFCHGRSTIAYKEKRNLIYLIHKKNDLDNLLLDILKNRYDSIIILESNYTNIIESNYYLTLISIYLTKDIAEHKNIDLSIVDYDKETCKMLYKYKGNM